MKRLLTVVTMLVLGGCSCWDTAYNSYCADTGACPADGGTAGGVGGGTAGGLGGGTAGGLGGGTAGGLGGGTAGGLGGGTGGGLGGGTAGGLGGGTAGGLGGGTAGGGLGGGTAGGGAAGGTGGGSPVYSLKLSMQPTLAGDCGTGTVMALVDGNPVPVTTAITVSLVNTGASWVTFYASAGCSSPTSAVSISAGTSDVSFGFKADLFGSATLFARGTGYTDGVAAFESTATLNLDPPLQTITDFSCTRGVLNVRAVGFGNQPVVASSNVSFSIDVTDPEQKLGVGATPNLCAASVVGTLAAGASYSTLYVGGTQGTPGNKVTASLTVAGTSPFANVGVGIANLFVLCRQQGATCSNNGECCNLFCQANTCQ